MIKEKWYYDHLFSGEKGIIHGINRAGDLYFYEDLARDGSELWAYGGKGQKIGYGFLFDHIFSSTDNITPVQGYSTPMSVSPGEEINFHITTGADNYIVTFLQLRKVPLGMGMTALSWMSLINIPDSSNR
jgi:hypothetical protein